MKFFIVEKIKKQKRLQRSLFVICLFFFLLIGITLPAKTQAQSIAMILTERAAAYQTVAQQIESQLGGQISSYDMQDSHSRDAVILAKISKQNPAMILALGDKAAQLASEKLTNYPILIGMVLELDKEIFLKPSIEGVGLQIPPESVLTQLRLVYPNLKRVGVLSSGTRFDSFRKSILSAAKKVGMSAVDITVPSKNLLDQKLSGVINKLDALWFLPDPSLLDSQTFRSVVNKTKRSKKALIVYSENFVKAGALFSVSPDYNATGQQLVMLSKKMLGKGDIQPEKPYLSKFHYPIGSYSVLNLKTADAIGLKLSEAQLSFINRIVNGKGW